jgi:hypothetical protein
MLKVTIALARSHKAMISRLPKGIGERTWYVTVLEVRSLQWVSLG